jgi:two-component system KDP operon response regulator KdpE
VALARSPGTQILVVDDEPRIRRFVRMALERNAWDVLDAATGEEAVDLARQYDPDLILLDINLPDVSGFDVLSRVRDFSIAPVIMLTGRDSEDDRVQGLDLGADDYVVKPFGVRELMARVRANLRRSSPRHDLPPAVSVEDLHIDFRLRQVHLAGDPVYLTPTEFALLTELAVNRGQVMLPGDLLRSIWGASYVDDLSLLRTAVWRVRRKLEPDMERPRYIVTVPRVGYTLGPWTGPPGSQPLGEP